MVCQWRSEDSLWESSLFPPCEAWGFKQVVKSGSKMPVPSERSCLSLILFLIKKVPQTIIFSDE